MGAFTLPTASVSAGGTTATEAAELDFFGEDLLFTDDLQVTASGDYALVSGYEALKQAIKIRLMTEPGEYAIHPEFGVGLTYWVKKRATQSQLDELRQRIIDQLGQEDRIDKVEEVTIDRIITQDKTGIRVLIRVTAIGRENSFAFSHFSE